MTVGKPSLPPRLPRYPPLRRFVVAEDSMRPTLEPGDGLIAVRSRRIRRGQLRVLEHPHRPGFWLVKRVGDVRGERFEALSDLQAAHVVDSRRFGDVPVTGTYRVVVRVPARFASGRGARRSG